MLYVHNYASALRCIGQALERNNIEIFELRLDGDNFLVQCGDPNPPYASILEFNFSPANIRILEREGQARRRQTLSEFRFDSLPEILRATGKYLDSNRAQLLRLNNCVLSETTDLELEYQTRGGEIRSEVLVMNSVRERAVEMYKQRTRIANPIEMLTRRN